MSEHTPTPWKLSGQARIVGPHPKGDGRNRHIATAIHDSGTWKQEQEANAAFIVDAANYHKILIVALSHLCRACRNLDFEAGRVDIPLSHAEDVLEEVFGKES